MIINATLKVGYQVTTLLTGESDFFSCAGHAFPAVCIRTSTERPEAMEKGVFILKMFPMKVVKIIRSCTGGVERFVWRR